MTIQPVDRAHARQTIDLLRDLRVTFCGIESPAMHTVLVDDGIAGRIDFRIAVEADRVVGLMLAAPSSYWLSSLLRRWSIGLQCVRARLRARVSRKEHHAAPPRPADLSIEEGPPPRSWKQPGDAWRAIFLGTTPAARGRGVGARLFESMMADRSLVARIAADNIASLRLNRSHGWRMFRDGDGVLSVHIRAAGASDDVRRQAPAAVRESSRRDAGFDKITTAPRS